MEVLKTLLILIIAIATCCIFHGKVMATPSAEFMYIESDAGGGWWEYDYTLFNTSDPIQDAGCDLYDVLFNFNSSVTIDVIQIPTGWVEIHGSDFGMVFSVMPGTPPYGADIAPGESLGGFIFNFNDQVGNLPFRVTFANPDIFSPSLIYSDVSSPNPIPEPATIILIGLGLIGLMTMKLGISRL